MGWDGLLAIMTTLGLVGNGIVMILSRVRKDDLTRIGKLEHALEEMERRVRHAQLNIAMLDERTKGGGE